MVHQLRAGDRKWYKLKNKYLCLSARFFKLTSKTNDNNISKTVREAFRGGTFVCVLFLRLPTDHSDVKFLFISEDLENVPYIEVCPQDNFQAIRDFMLVPVVNAKNDTTTTIAKEDFASWCGD